MKEDELARALRSILEDLREPEPGVGKAQEFEVLLGRALATGRALGLEAVAAGERLALSSEWRHLAGLEIERGTEARSEEEPQAAFVQPRDIFSRLPFEIGAAGRRLLNAASTSAIGPFLDRLADHIFFEIIRPAQKLLVTAPGLPQPWLILTRATPPRSSESTVRIHKGTVWVLARTLDSNAPAGAYVGFLVEEATLRLPSPPTMSGSTLVTTGALEGELRMKQSPEPDPDPRVTAPPPDDLTIRWKSSAVSFTAAEGRASIASWSVTFLPGSRIKHDAAYQQIVFGFHVERALLDSSLLSTSTFDLQGESELVEAGWAVPLTTISDPAALPEAAGSRAWVASLQGAVRARWRGGPAGGATLPSARLIIWRHGYALLDQGARRRSSGDAHTFELWRLPRSPHRARLEAHLEPTFFAGFGATEADGPLIFFEARFSPHFDRPLSADGSVVPIPEEKGLVSLNGELEDQSVLALSTSLSQETPNRRSSLVLENAVLSVTTPRFFGLRGRLAGGAQVVDAHANVVVPVSSWFPSLPDPYVANITVSRKGNQRDRPTTYLTASFSWEEGEAALAFSGALNDVSFSRAPASEPGSKPARSFGEPWPYPSQTGQGAHVDAHEARRTEAGRAKLKEFLGGAPGRLKETAHLEARFRPGDGIRLLDVSTARHQIGVQIGPALESRSPSVPLTHLPSSAAATWTGLAVTGTRLATRLAQVRVFSLPQIQWEPVRTLDKDQDAITLGIFPTPLASRDDGGPSVIGAFTAKLTSTIPDVALDGLVQAHSEGEKVALVTTLPFGIRALVELQARQSGPRAADGFGYVMPKFEEAKKASLAGGLQVSLSAQGGATTPGAESPSFVGATMQTLNGVELATGAPLGISVLGSTLGGAASVESIFNKEFVGARPRVPLTRYDWSGYGASTFSDWANPRGAFAETTKAQFQVLVGRTALEVIKVASVVYPWGIRVTRSITIERRGGGGVIRKDSGWQALGPGLFDFTSSTITTQPFEIHPGLIRGVYSVDRIRPLANDAVTLPGGGQVLPIAFDAEVAIEGLVESARPRSKGMLGFLHIQPVGSPLSPEDLAALLETQGASGGNVEARFEIGGSRLRARALRVEVAHSLVSGTHRFVGAVRAVPQFGPSGAWSVVRGPGPGNPAAPAETSAVVDGVPIVREGKALPTDNVTIHAPLVGPYRFADPTDLFRGSSPHADYGFLQSDSTHRFLYRRPHIQPGAPRVQSDLAPAFADFFAATTSKGLFPPLENTIALTDHAYRLEVQASTGFLRLNPPVDVPAPRGDLILSDTASDAIRVVYAGSRLRLSISEDRWQLSFDDVELWNDFSFMSGANGTRASLQGGTGGRAQLNRVETLLNPVLEDIFSILPGMGDRGVHGPVDLGATNLKLAWKISAGIDKIIEAPPYAAIRLFAMVDIVGEQNLSPPPPPPPTGPGTLSGGGGFSSSYLAAKVGFEARFSIPIDPYPVAVVFGWGIELGGKLILSGPDAGKMKGLVELSIYVGVAFGKELGPFKALVTTGAGFLFQQEGSAVGIGGFIFLEITAKLPPVAKLKVFGEFACLVVEKPTGKYQKWAGEVGINITIFYLVSIKFSANVSDEKKLH